MGMFDSIYVKIKCPFCEQVKELECQTKELDCMCMTYLEGDSISTKKFNYIDASVRCNSENCTGAFDIQIKIKKGIITGKYKLKYHE